MSKYLIVYQNWKPYAGNDDTRGFISQRFSASHLAIDSVGNYNDGKSCTPVHSVINGTVEAAYYDSYYGNVITISNEKVSVSYRHLEKMFVATGDNVAAGEIVAYEGGTGKYATDKHLHTTMKIDGEIVDPELYLAGKKEIPFAENPDNIDELARDVIRGKYGNGNERKEALGDKYDAVQKRVNEMLCEVKPAYDIDQLAWGVIRGEYGNGAARKAKLGDKYDAVQKRVNELLKEILK